MIYIFGERKFVFKKGKLERSQEDIDSFAEGLIDHSIESDRDAEKILSEQNLIRNQFNDFDLFSKEDKERWKNKLEKVKKKPSLSEIKKLQAELNEEQKEVKKMFKDYSGEVDANLKSAFTKDSVKEYKQEFAKQSTEIKRDWFNELQNQIKERKNLRDELIKLHPEVIAKDEREKVKKQIFELRRHEMAEKVVEFRERRNNIEAYTKKIEKDRAHFSDKSFEEFIIGFMKLMTLDDQKRWLDEYEKQAEKRRLLSAQFREFSLNRQRKHNKFWQMSRHEKAEHLEKMKQEVDSEYEAEIKKYSDKDVPPVIKNKYRDYFKNLSMEDKEYAISNVREWLENDKKYEHEYSKIPEEIRELPRYKRQIWKKTSFEGKEQMIRDMKKESELLKEGEKVLDAELKAKTITKNTYIAYRKKLLKMKLSEKIVALEQFETGMKRRRDDAKQFKLLSKDTQIKFAPFWKGERYNERHTILLKALQYEASLTANKIKKKNKKMANLNTEEREKSFEKPENIKEQIRILQFQADLMENQGQTEQAIGMHKAVLLLDKKNKVSKDKIKSLTKESENDKAWEDENLLESLIAEAALTENSRDERENIEIAESFLKEQESVENISQTSNFERQQDHIDSDLSKDLDRAVLDLSGKKKRIGRDGRSTDINQIDTKWLGTGEDKRKKTVYKKILRGKKDSENLETVRVIDEKGKEENVNTAKKKLKTRKEKLKKKLAKRAQRKLKQKEGEKAKSALSSLEEIADDTDISVDLAA